MEVECAGGARQGGDGGPASESAWDNFIYIPHTFSGKLDLAKTKS